jgi:heme-degrading monooxygenase HmoA
MILEVAILNVRPGKATEFEAAFKQAEKIIKQSKGYIDHQLQKCFEIDNQYILLVNWETLEDHTEGFRKSERYQDWKNLLHHFYEPFPTVEHYSQV